MNSYSTSILRTLQASASIDQRFTNTLSAIHGISLRDLMLMLYVKNSTGSKLSRVELARKLCVSPSTVTRASNPLEKIGLLGREADSRDARLSYVVLTTSGRKLLKNAEQTMEQLSKDFLSPRLGQKELESYGKYIEKMAVR